jgi:hypothetical protein
MIDDLMVDESFGAWLLIWSLGHEHIAGVYHPNP